jgi:SAM-dependent methyltransferase
MFPSAFDKAASSYDQDFTETPIGILQRKRVLRYLYPLLDKKHSVLEVNCGTGQDAIWMAPHVRSVLATDISEEMVKVARAKATAAGTNNTRFEVHDLRNLHPALKEKYDLVLSDFGGFNCLTREELSEFAVNIAPQLNEKARLVLVIMGKHCFIENLWFRLRRDARVNRRATTQGVAATVGSQKLITWYYSPNEVTHVFKSSFNVKLIRPIGLFIPPSFLNGFFAKRKWLLKLCWLAECVFGNLQILADYADHYLIVLEKRPVNNRRA